MRYERKYRIEETSPDLVKAIVRRHPAGFRVLYPDRRINNIYFDTADYRAFNENVAGIAQRRKYRIRWYGDDYSRLHRPVLETKIKDNELGGKENRPLESVPWEELPRLFGQTSLLRYHNLFPVLVNTYRRSYFGSANGKFRITVDWDLAYAPWRTDGAIPFSLRQDDVILELKYEAADEKDAGPVWGGLPFRQTKNSKFVSGIQMLYG